MAVTFQIDESRSEDPVRTMIGIVDSGYHCRIWYDKQDGVAPTERVIEPRQLVDSLSGLMIRALQIAPENGVRSFKVHRIVRVEADTKPLSKAQMTRNQFSTGEVVAFRSSDATAWREPHQAPDPSGGLLHKGRAAWTAPWFSAYVARLRDALVDLSIDSREEADILAVQRELGLTEQQIEAAHCYVVAEELLGFAADGWIDERETSCLNQLCACLARVGGSPLS